jgi:predicted peptidase
MFIHDAGAVSNYTQTTLLQGLGGVVWATPSEQAKHESFVLAPQYSKVIVNDNSQATQDLDVTVDLIKSLEGQYNIDQNRVYTTGQSMGCMSSIALLIKYPNMFAGAMLVAGQWDPTKVAPMAKDNLWIIVSQGDVKAYPGMNAITDTLEKQGAKVSRTIWDGRANELQFTYNVIKMIEQGNNNGQNNIKYTVLKKGTVVPPSQLDNPGSNHINTWRIAYTIEGVRDWLFTQVKTSR